MQPFEQLPAYGVVSRAPGQVGRRDAGGQRSHGHDVGEPRHGAGSPEPLGDQLDARSESEDGHHGLLPGLTG